MSKLDNIFKEANSVPTGATVKDKFCFRMIDIEYAKKQIKSVMLELVGDNLANTKSTEGHPVAMYYVNKRLEEIRNKVEKL
jgi:hypothetical protein